MTEIRTEGIAALARFLNDHNGTATGEMTMQMLKLSEEAGELSEAISIAVGKVAQAWIGYQGQNPRKGQTHTLDDVLSELADVAITAMVGIARLGGDPGVVVGGKVAVMEERYAQLEVAE